MIVQWKKILLHVLGNYKYIYFPLHLLFDALLNVTCRIACYLLSH